MSEPLNELAAALAKAQAQTFGQYGNAEHLAITALARRSYKRRASKNALDQLLSKVVFGASECWHWIGCTDKGGYGRLATQNHNFAHRAAFELFNGPVPDGMKVLHKCDVRGCVNPAHLFLGTQTDNMRDMAAKGRGRSPRLHGEKNPMSRLTAADVAAIRADRAANGTQYKTLAQRFGVSVMTICRAINQKTWVH